MSSSHGSCLAGTGDFRIGLFDSNHGKHIDSDGFCKADRYSDMIKQLEKKPFNIYRGCACHAIK
jgi:hypothetical protein